MEIIPTWVWFASGLLFLVIELNTVTFFFGIVGVGALLAAVVDLFFAGEISSFITFILGSSVAAYLAWKLNIYSGSSSGIRTGADRLIGKIGVVEEQIQSSTGSGIITVEGEKWRAKSNLDENIKEGTKVIVKNIEGTTLVVDLATNTNKQSEVDKS